MNDTRNQGLYVPQAEKDSCGVGLLANLKNKKSHHILDDALTMLENMEHRGACGCDENTGDGAGILLQVPFDFFERELPSNLEIEIPDEYGIGMFFFPKDQVEQDYCMERVIRIVDRYDFNLFHVRDVPVDNSMLGKGALDSEPDIKQLYIQYIGEDKDKVDLEKKLYFLRSHLMKYLYNRNGSLRDTFYITSLSSKTIVYKGQLRAIQLRDYFKDLSNTRFTTAVAIVHSRFSTNTVPKWKLAQPFRCIAHNGEINTIQGNINWWKARERHLETHQMLFSNLPDVFPVCDPYLSDSGNFDNVVDFLIRTTRSIPHALMMMIPEAWQNDPTIPKYKKDFYAYHDAIMEPWDGPASICFTDGTLVGATLDRNGLRPSRYLVTDDDLLVLASEAGVIDIDPSKIAYKGKLQPGKILVADLDEGRIITDQEVKETICKRKPYGQWLESNNIHIDKVATRLEKEEEHKLSLYQRKLVFGFTKEDQDLILDSMIGQGKEPIGSMGADIPLAVLSKLAQHPSHYFKQQFAQVTNPPIDPLRESTYMSLITQLCGTSQVIRVGADEARTITIDSPVLLPSEYTSLKYQSRFNVSSIDTTFDPSELDLLPAIKSTISQALKKVENGAKLLLLSDEDVDQTHVAIPSLLLVGALHHALIESGLRKDVSIILKGGDIWETHHVATLLSYGVDAVYPHLAMDTVLELNQTKDTSDKEAIYQYRKAVNKGLLKIMSKLGISTLQSYKGAQTFEALGISTEVVDVCFKGTVTRIEGMTFDDLQRECLAKHRLAFHTGGSTADLPDAGVYHWNQRGEYHIFNPQSIHLLQFATKTNNKDVYNQYTAEIDKVTKNASTLRSFFDFKSNAKAIPIEEVEPVSEILKRFASGAMSFGSISKEAHTTLAIAMNRIGAKSNSGEGGEDAARFDKKENGDWERSAIKQVASGRFGVTSHYLTNAEEIQIKMAQGAKPGEGGQLPGHKVDLNIARVRHSTPGVGLISPPPHHDIYSIEDLAQLIYDLKNANRQARISVKLVSKSGVGVIASGVTKAHADHILISGFDGGTGASPLSSIRHAGLPWEMGLSETHQTLLLNGLRDRVTLQADGQMRTGRDLAVATLLGAEEWGVATAALVVEGCILMRKCHLNTCPVGIATQDPELRAKFDGKVDHLVNYFHFLAQDLREIMASLGFKTINEMVGRSDLLKVNKSGRHWKTANLDLSPILQRVETDHVQEMYKNIPQDHGLDEVLDHKLIASSLLARNDTVTTNNIFDVKSTDRAVGTMLSNEISKQYGAAGMPEESIAFRFKGSAGQSFGAFGVKGLFFTLEGEANDYFGKGLCGAKLILVPDREAKYLSQDNIIAGNVALYGATSGQVYIRGQAGDRFCVRNSGATAIVEGIGDNGCEYMTGGKVIILGEVGRNFGAGMSGGTAYLYQPEGLEESKINHELVELGSPNQAELEEIRAEVRLHFKHTASPLALEILQDWDKSKGNFVQVMPKGYLEALKKAGLLTNTKAS